MADGKTPATSASFSADGEWRVEHDSMGEMRVPVDALWGAQT